MQYVVLVMWVAPCFQIICIIYEIPLHSCFYTETLTEKKLNVIFFGLFWYIPVAIKQQLLQSMFLIQIGAQ